MPAFAQNLSSRSGEGSSSAVPRLPSRASVPIPAIPGGWVPVPRKLLERLGPALAKVERAVVDLLLLRTIGDEAGGRPEWAAITAAEFARYAGATVDGIHRALARLEGSLKAIESQADGRGKRYRLALEHFGEVQAPAPRKLKRKPPHSEGFERIADPEATPQSAEHPALDPGLQAADSPKPAQTKLVLEYGDRSPGEPITIEPGSRPVPIEFPQPEQRVTVRNRTAYRFLVETRATGHGIELSVAEVPTALGAWSAEYINECREFLSGFIPVLHAAPREKDVLALAAARNNRVPIRQLQANIERRVRGGLVLTGYGIFAALARDCLDSVETWIAAHAPPQAPRASPSIRERLLEWAGQVERAGPAFEQVALELQRCAADPTVIDDPERLNAIVSDPRTREGAIAVETLRDRIPEFRRIAAEEVRPYHGRMTCDQIRSLEQQSVERQLLEALSLPYFNLEFC